MGPSGRILNFKWLLRRTSCITTTTKVQNSWFCQSSPISVAPAVNLGLIFLPSNSAKKNILFNLGRRPISGFPHFNGSDGQNFRKSKVLPEWLLENKHFPANQTIFVVLRASPISAAPTARNRVCGRFDDFRGFGSFPRFRRIQRNLVLIFCY